MAVTEEATWAPPTTRKPTLPDVQDRKDMAKTLGLEDIEYSDFIKSGYWDVDDALRPIYEQASEKLGREFKYPGD
jgi:ribonuclease Z